jgi:CheY-like chemotaxis protein
MAEVLIVDDSLATRILVREILAPDQSLTFTEAEDGLVAAERIRVHQPDVVILDFQMPHLNGLELYHLLKADPELAEIPIVVFTVFWGIYSDFVGLEWHNFVKKPFEERELISAVSGALGTHRVVNH